MDESDRERSNEMAQPVLTNYDPEITWVVVAKDYDEGSIAMWREYERFSTRDEALHALKNIRENQNAYEDQTGYEPSVAYKIVRDEMFDAIKAHEATRE